MKKNLEQSEVFEKADNSDANPTLNESDSKKNQSIGEHNQIESHVESVSLDENPIPEKFASARELAKAYEELQAEFTKKSQRQKHLEQELAQYKDKACEAQLGKVNDVPQVNDAVPQVRNSAKNTEEIIKDYLLSVAAGRTAPTVIAGSGNGFVSAEISGARSMNTTTKMVENFLLNKGKC